MPSYSYMPHVEYRCALDGCDNYKVVDVGPLTYPTDFPPPVGWIAAYTVCERGAVSDDCAYFCSWAHAADHCGRQPGQKAAG